MRAPISVVIPTLNAEHPLVGLLSDLVEGVGEGLVREVIVSDGGSSDGTREAAGNAGAAVVEGPPGRGDQLRRGCAAAGGDWLWSVHADTRLPRGWTDAVARHLSTDRAGWARLSFRSAARAARRVAAWANLRSRLGLPYGDQTLLLPRALYDAAGGYEDVPLMEDVRLVSRLRGRLAPMDLTILTDASRYEAEGWTRRGARNLSLLARHAMGADPAALSRSYRRALRVDRSSGRD